MLGSIVVSIPACHAGDRGSIPRRGDFFFYKRIYKIFFSDKKDYCLFQKSRTIFSEFHININTAVVFLMYETN